jgi:DNA-binding cell septation regulator SpoVG
MDSVFPYPKHPATQSELRRSEALLAPRRAGPSMKILKFAPVTSGGSMLAFLDVELPSGIIIRDVRLMRGQNGDPWIVMPSIKQTDRDGNPIIGDKGKPLYRSLVDFKDRATRDKFTAALIAVVRREHPDIVGDSV